MTARLTRAEKQAQTRAALLDAAQTVCLERGFTGASVQRITAEAGYTRGAFYSNFESKEQLFVELLRDRIFSSYEQLVRRRLERPDHMPSMRESGEELARLQVNRETDWLFRLFLEVLAHAGRHEDFRAVPAKFWNDSRAMLAQLVIEHHRREGTPVPADPQLLATAMVALNLGLGIQRYVDRDAVPLDTWPELFDLLFPPRPRVDD